MVDVSPELKKEIKTQFDKLYGSSSKIKSFQNKLASGKATYADAYYYANEVGNIRAKVVKNCISSAVLPDGKMYYNIADNVVRDFMESDVEAISSFCADVQKAYNKRNGIGLKAQPVEVDEDRIMGFINRISSEPWYDDIAWILDEPLKTLDRKTVDDSVKKNAEFQHRAGLKATVTRTASYKCCDWCSELEGEYTYPGVPQEVFARHDNCRCTIEYNSQKMGTSGHAFVG